MKGNQAENYGGGGILDDVKDFLLENFEIKENYSL